MCYYSTVRSTEARGVAGLGLRFALGLYLRGCGQSQGWLGDEATRMEGMQGQGWDKNCGGEKRVSREIKESLCEGDNVVGFEPWRV